jgi:hypothetical protein
VRAWRLGALLAGVSLAAPAVAAAQAPPEGTRYVGKTSQGFKLRARVVEGGGLTIRFRDVARCSNGRRVGAKAAWENDRPSLQPDGRFDYRKTYRDIPASGDVRWDSFDERQRLSGRATAQRLRGKLRSTVRFEDGPRCRVRLSFRARART